MSDRGETSDRGEAVAQETVEAEVCNPCGVTQRAGAAARTRTTGVRSPARRRNRTAVPRQETPGPQASPEASDDLRSHELYLNRELTWLAFNRRVLNEAQDKRNPLLERVKFLAIASSNMDEFFMKRIGGLKQQVATNVHQLTVDGRTPQQQLTECAHAEREMQSALHQVYMDLVKSLRAEALPA